MDPSVWKAFAGGSVFVPAVGSVVYYFPDGHAEQASSPPAFGLVRPPLVLAEVLSVDLLADHDTDEVFARIRLRPIDNLAGTAGGTAGGGGGKAPAYAKKLTQSDANNGGGFSVPRCCADMIFPALDYGANPPAQNIGVKDAHGESWSFRHIYRGTPRRHLLTTGWSKFVNHKKLVHGDSVVFVRGGDGAISVGIRRGWRPGDGAWRNGRGRLPPESVAEAAELAAEGKDFEVVHYPKAGRAEFVVPVNTVESAAMAQWSVGARLKMAAEMDTPARTTYHHGSIDAIIDSPWRILQVKWDHQDHHASSHLPQRVNPWEVELSTDFVHTEVAKKMRLNNRPELLFPGEDYLSQLKLPRFNPTLYPAGMQGARQSPFWASSEYLLPFSKHFINNFNQLHREIAQPTDSFENSDDDDAAGQLPSGIVQRTDSCSLMSENSDDDAAAGGSPVKQSGVTFKLFGQVIEVDHELSDAGEQIDNACGRDHTPSVKVASL